MSQKRILFGIISSLKSSHPPRTQFAKRNYANKVLQIHSKNLVVDPSTVRFDPVNILPTTASASFKQEEDSIFSSFPANNTAANELTSERIEQILQFWFGDMLDTKPGHKLPGFAQRLENVWFAKDTRELDKLIQLQFEQDLHTLVMMRRSGQNVLELSARGLLASIIILDQLPRSMYRNTPKAYKYDSTALTLAKKTVESSTDLLLLPVHRAFVYLPFLHSEAILDQVKSVQLYKQLVKDPSIHPDDVALFQGFLKQAEEYLKVIERFGRFPHRNEILGRATTKEEAEYLKI